MELANRFQAFAYMYKWNKGSTWPLLESTHSAMQGLSLETELSYKHINS